MQQQAQQVQHLQQQQMAIVDPRSNVPQPGAIDVVTNPHTTTIQLAEFSSVMVYTLWHTRPNINGASSNAYNMVPHRISVPPSAGPAFKKFCLKVRRALQKKKNFVFFRFIFVDQGGLIKYCMLIGLTNLGAFCNAAFILRDPLGAKVYPETSKEQSIDSWATRFRVPIIYSVTDAG